MCEGAYKCAEVHVTGDPKDASGAAMMGLYYATGKHHKGHPTYRHESDSHGTVSKGPKNTMYWTPANSGSWIIDKTPDPDHHGIYIFDHNLSARFL